MELVLVGGLGVLYGLAVGIALGKAWSRPQGQTRPEPKMRAFHIIEDSGGESVRRLPREDDE